MALNPELIAFFKRNIRKSDITTFGAEVSHLFEHLNNEIKDNQVFENYRLNCKNWENWPDRNSYLSWHIPSKFEDAKSLAFRLYNLIGEQGHYGYKVAAQLTQKYEGNINSSIQKFNDIFMDYLDEVLNEIIKANPEIESGQVEKVKGDIVFIIHGHDNEMKAEVQLLLARAGVNNIVLHEQTDRGRTIIDKLVEESKNANYAIALITPDDILNDGTKRARQNVVLEVGYFMGKLGKERVRLIKKGDAEIPSDLHGVLYENHDKSGAWKIKLCNELIAVGIHVNMEMVTRTL
jgi:predicted nucleotide-binding protein